MNLQGSLKRLGFQKSGRLPADHFDVGQPCILCKRPILAGDTVGDVPVNPEEGDSRTNTAHWRCIERAFDSLRQRGDVAPEATRRFLESWAKPVKNDTAADECPYASEADFILRHGRAFEWRALPRGVGMGSPRLCFDNATRLALRAPRRYTYTEGYAINRLVAGNPVAHAWCIDQEGFVVDRTWDNGAAYFGVPFRVEYVRLIRTFTKDYGLINNEEMDYPLLTGAHAAADAIKG